MTKKQKINLEKNVSSYVEKCWYEWNCYLEILKYISSTDSLTDHREYYTTLATDKYIELELTKNEVINEIQLSLNSTIISYEFDFRNYALIVEVEDV